MSWYVRQFDPHWVRCQNVTCRAEFTLESIQGRRKCPKCKMDNQYCIKEAARIKGETPS